MDVVRGGGGGLFLPAGPRRARGEVHAPEGGRQPDQQRQVGDIIDQRVGDHLLAGAALGAQHQREDEVADARAVGHHQRPQHGALQAVVSHRLQPPDHEQRGQHKDTHKRRRRPRPGAFDHCHQRLQGAQLTSPPPARQGGFVRARGPLWPREKNAPRGGARRTPSALAAPYGTRSIRSGKLGTMQRNSNGSSPWAWYQCGTPAGMNRMSPRWTS